MGESFRALREALGGAALPYVWVPELHKDGVHFHIHFAVGRYLPRHLIVAAWGRGIVDIRAWTGRVGVPLPPLWRPPTAD